MTPRRPSRLAPIEGEREVKQALQALADAEGVRGLARRLKVSATTVSRVLLGQDRVSGKLAKACGFQKVIVFRRLD